MPPSGKSRIGAIRLFPEGVLSLHNLMTTPFYLGKLLSHLDELLTH